MKAFNVNIIGLSNSDHEFTFEVSRSFFEEYGAELISDGSFTATVILKKTETFIEAKFRIHGTAKLVCDRSLEPFDLPLNIQNRMIFKYGEEEADISDEISIISPDRAKLDLGQYIYEFISLAIPIKKIHPRFAEKESQGNWIYTSAKKNETEIDPRWDQLKKLK